MVGRGIDRTLVAEAQEKAWDLLDTLERHRPGDMRAITCRVTSRIPFLDERRVTVDAWSIGEVLTRSTMRPRRQIALSVDGRIVYDGSLLSYEALARMGDVLPMIIAKMNGLMTSIQREATYDGNEDDQHSSLDHKRIAEFARHYAETSESVDITVWRERLNSQARGRGLPDAEQQIGEALGAVLLELSNEEDVLRPRLQRLNEAVKPYDERAAAADSEQPLLRSLLTEAKRQYEEVLQTSTPDDHKADERWILISALGSLRESTHIDLSCVLREYLDTPTKRRLARYQRWKMPAFLVRRATADYVEEETAARLAALKRLDGYVRVRDWQRTKRSIEALTQVLSNQIPVDGAKPKDSSHQEGQFQAIRACPECNGVRRETIRPGVFLCLSPRLVGATPARYISPALGWQPPQPVYEECGNVYREP